MSFTENQHAHAGAGGRGDGGEEHDEFFMELE
jgi:hypothetical protein